MREIAYALLVVLLTLLSVSLSPVSGKLVDQMVVSLSR